MDRFEERIDVQRLNLTLDSLTFVKQPINEKENSELKLAVSLEGDRFSLVFFFFCPKQVT